MRLETVFEGFSIGLDFEKRFAQGASMQGAGRLAKFLGVDTFSRDLLEFGHNQGWDSSKFGGNDWVYQSSRPHLATVGRIPGTPGAYSDGSYAQESSSPSAYADAPTEIVAPAGHADAPSKGGSRRRSRWRACGARSGTSPG